MKKAALETPPIQSLDRGLCILEAVAKSTDPVSLGHLTELLGVDRSSAFRLANTLKRRGFLANASGRKDYVLGPSIWRLSRQYDWSGALITLCHGHLKALAGRTGETAHIAVREGRKALFIDHCAPTSQVILVTGQTGESAPLYCTGHGKALLADFSVADLKAVFGAATLRAYTPHTIVSLSLLARACAKIKAEGFATDDEEYQEGVRCLAAPIRDKDGEVVATIGISAPLTRLPEERYTESAKHVSQAAREVTGILSAGAP
jgi:IclR family transcriptional regulator, acetate operon repressor